MKPCNFRFLLLTKSIQFVFQLNLIVIYQASDNSLPSALLQAISTYYQAKLWNGPLSADGRTFPSWDLWLKKKCIITADQPALQRHLEDSIIIRKNQNDPKQRKSTLEGLLSEKKKRKKKTNQHLYLLSAIYNFREPAYGYCYWIPNIWNMASRFSPDTWLSEALFLFSFCNTKFKKLFYRAPAIFHISITCQIKVYECHYENTLFIKISQNIMTWIFVLKLK